MTVNADMMVMPARATIERVRKEYVEEVSKDTVRRAGPCRSLRL
jgi:hypothetical protein